MELAHQSPEEDKIDPPINTQVRQTLETSSFVEAASSIQLSCAQKSRQKQGHAIDNTTASAQGKKKNIMESGGQ